MVRPRRFYSNPETALTNAFQTPAGNQVTEDEAVREFDEFVDCLGDHGVNVITIDDTPEPPTPDAVFPNNWISTHSDGSVVTYPMQPVSRRAERRLDVLDRLRERGYDVRRHLDLSALENDDVFLEGTGSMVLDRVHRRAYACWSARTHEAGLRAFCRAMIYEPVGFDAADQDGQAIYHTNVMMCVGDRFIVACVDAIDPAQRPRVVRAMQADHELIEISVAQMNAFAGNMLQVIGTGGEALLIMSQRARASLNADQVAALAQYARIVAVPIPNIEDAAGGSVRCMLAEIFLPRGVSL